MTMTRFIALVTGVFCPVIAWADTKILQYTPDITCYVNRVVHVDREGVEELAEGTFANEAEGPAFGFSKAREAPQPTWIVFSDDDIAVVDEPTEHDGVWEMHVGDGMHGVLVLASNPNVSWGRDEVPMSLNTNFGHSYMTLYGACTQNRVPG